MSNKRCLMKKMMQFLFPSSVKRVVRGLVLTGFVFSGSSVLFARDLTKVYYVRHAEGGHNVVSEWKNKPKDQWPVYVGNPDMFTPKGEQQVDALTRKLQTMKFDFIATSPMWRARNTILPYLNASGKKAEIWPELTEVGRVAVNWTVDPGSLPAPSPTVFVGKGAIRLPESEQPFFIFRDDATRELNVYDKDEKQYAANNLTLARRIVEMIKARFGKSGKSILLVGHGNSGSNLLRTLTSATALAVRLENTAIWMAEEQPDGSFVLKMVNNRMWKRCPRLQSISDSFAELTAEKRSLHY